MQHDNSILLKHGCVFDSVYTASETDWVEIGWNFSVCIGIFDIVMIVAVTHL